jgi:hypothetical protein
VISVIAYCTRTGLTTRVFQAITAGAHVLTLIALPKYRHRTSVHRRWPNWARSQNGSPLRNLTRMGEGPTSAC